MSRAEDVVMRLYEDSALRGGLTDAPAARLLKWAEDRLIALDDAGVDDAAFAAAAAAVLAAVRQINTAVDKTLAAGGIVPPDAAQAFAAQAAISADQVTAGVSGDAPADEMALVERLIGLVSAEAGPQTAPPAALPEVAAVPVAAPADTAQVVEKGKAEDNFLAGWANRLLEQDAPVASIDSKPDEPEGEDDDISVDI
ncbi:MAG: hypothetical protein L6Q98_11705 [Anaerolineae bacterium]|nr:hypothetical protein [Anaerolineae bacterium]NUQ04512.1 hypothetical protein [Anaerolineae bacterium]